MSDGWRDVDGRRLYEPWASNSAFHEQCTYRAMERRRRATIEVSSCKWYAGHAKGVPSPLSRWDEAALRLFP